MAQGSVITDEMKKAIGVESPAATCEIERGHIRRFAEAIGDPNPLFNDEAQARNTRYGGMVAPPTFLRACVAPPTPVEPTASGLERRLDGGSEWEYFHPVRPGDRISVTSKIVDFKERDGRMGRMLITTVQQTYRNQFGEVVATQKSTRILY